MMSVCIILLYLVEVVEGIYQETPHSENSLVWETPPVVDVAVVRFFLNLWWVQWKWTYRGNNPIPSWTRISPSPSPSSQLANTPQSSHRTSSCPVSIPSPKLERRAPPPCRFSCFFRATESCRRRVAAAYHGPPPREWSGKPTVQIELKKLD